MTDLLLTNVGSQLTDITVHHPLWKYIFDGVCGIATILIAVVNIIYIYKFHNKQDEAEKIVKEKDRKMMLLKTLILDHNLMNLYTSFDNLSNHLQILKKEDNNRKDVEKNIQTDLKALSENFIFLLSAVNSDLYNNVLAESDKLRDTLVENLADDGIRLTVESKYKQYVNDPCMNAKKSMLAILFSYKGD